MHVLITGGAGFLGSHLVDAFLDRGDEVSILDIGSIGKIQHRIKEPRLHLVRGSIFDDVLDGLIRRADLVYHLAAVVGVEHYVGDPSTCSTSTSTARRTSSTPRTSTRSASSSPRPPRSTAATQGAVEGGGRPRPRLDPDRPLVLLDVQGGRRALLLRLPPVGPAGDGRRYFNVYGPRLDKIDVGRVITIFMGQLLRNEP